MVIVTPLSRWQLSTQEEEKIKDVFGKKLAEITDAGEMRSMMKTLLSRSEYLMLAKRLVAFVLIEEGYPDVEIGRILHVTRATANRFRLTYRYAKEKNEPLNCPDVPRRFLDAVSFVSPRTVLIVVRPVRVQDHRRQSVRIVTVDEILEDVVHFVRVALPNVSELFVEVG